MASLATSREKRSKAGNRMSKLLTAEDDDDFYKTTYGGFNEEGDDNDYASEDSLDDQVDSDFDIDENDEVRSDMEDDNKPKRKRQGISTKAYKEPKKAKTDESAPKKHKKPKKKREKSTVQIYHSEPIGKKTLRHSTAKKSEDTEAKQKERELRDQMMREYARRRNVANVRRLTQEELLAEAKITEEINLRSLEIYRKMELEKKRARGVKQKYCGPMVRYHSVAMPLIEELPTETEINVDTDNGENGAAVQPVVKPAEFCSRTFITFTDEETFHDVFRAGYVKPKIPIKQYCPVTRLPAKYFDPVTKSPFANSHAFRVLRESYAQQLESRSGSERKERTRGSSQIAALAT